MRREIRIGSAGILPAFFLAAKDIAEMGRSVLRPYTCRILELCRVGSVGRGKPRPYKAIRDLRSAISGRRVAL